MKLLGIGDLFIPKEYIEKGFASFAEMGIHVQTVNWDTGSLCELQRMNQQVEYGGSEVCRVPAGILQAAENAEIIITQFCPVNKELIDAARNLKYIGVLRAGYENINVEYASSKGIVIFHTPGRNADSVADFTVGAMLCECRNIARGHQGLKEGKWLREYPNSAYIPDLPGKKAGIVGLGEIGLKVVKRLLGFDLTILGYDPYYKGVNPDITLVSLEELAKEADFISIHARYTKETERLISKDMIALMKPTAYLINTSRPGLLDEGALFEALRDRKIAGAALDVFNVEPPGKDYPLIQLENVTVTPHMAGGSTDAFYNSPRKLALEIEKYFKTQESRQIINRNVLVGRE